MFLGGCALRTTTNNNNNQPINILQLCNFFDLLDISYKGIMVGSYVWLLGH